MKIKKITVILSLCVIMVLPLVVSVSADGDGITGVSPSDSSIKVILPDDKESVSSKKEEEVIKHESSLSYALQIIRRNKKLIKTAAAGNIGFERSDFSDFTGGGEVYSLTIKSLPDVSDGILKLGALDAFAGQSLSSSLISKLTFIPAYKGAEAEFSFSVNGEDEENVCCLYSLKTQNDGPQISSVTVYTKQNVALFSNLPVTDPDGDSISVSVIEQPEHGLIKIGDNGAFTYIPAPDYLGDDVFVCVASDKYGNESEPATVKIKVERNTSGIVYSDIKGTAAEYPAYLLAERGILTGENVGGTVRFEPEKNVTRADFIVMAMKAAGYSPNVYSSLRGGFEDADKLTEDQRGYVVTALSAGVLDCDDYESVRLIRPSSSVTVGEAEKIISALCGTEVASGTDKDSLLDRAGAACLIARVIDGRR